MSLGFVQHIHYEREIVLPWGHSWPGLFGPLGTYTVRPREFAVLTRENLRVREVTGLHLRCRLECWDEVTVRPVAFHAGHRAEGAVERRALSTTLIPLCYLESSFRPLVLPYTRVEPSFVTVADAPRPRTL